MALHSPMEMTLYPNIAVATHVVEIKSADKVPLLTSAPNGDSQKQPQTTESKDKGPMWSIISPEIDRGLVHLPQPQSIISPNVKFGVQWKAAIDGKNAETEQMLNEKWKGPFEDWLTERLNREFKVRGGELMDWIRSVNSSTVGFHFEIRDLVLGDIVARNSKWAKNLAKTLVFEQHAVNLVDFGCRWFGRFCCRRLLVHVGIGSVDPTKII